MGALSVYLLVYGVLALSHIGVQMLLAHLEYLRQRRRLPGEEYEPSVTVVVPAYNEDPDLLYECLRSLDRQDYGGSLEVVVVDDGSRNREELLPIQEEFGRERFRTLLAPQNMGKRHCQAIVFNEIRADVVVTIDSDTVLEPDSIRTIVRPLSDPRVGAVTGNVRVINQKRNFLTRLISYRYWSAFNQERAAQSLFKVVMCASGPFSAYRRAIIDQVKDRYVGQTFLGEACTFGDDRHLTNLVLDLGFGVVYEKDAIAWTHVPDTIPKYLHQQVRWNKSFYREILWTARFAHRRHPYLAIDLTLQAVLPFMLLGALTAMTYQAIFVDLKMLWLYLGILVTIGLIRASYGLWRTREPGFLSFAVYGFIHVGLLIPTRLYALATIRRGHWGTRKRKRVIAEVRDEDLMLASTFGRAELERLLAQQGGGLQATGRGALVVLDIDGLRDVNLVYGHRAGERLVHEVSEVLRGRLESPATVLRIGGDEFGVMLPDADNARAEAVASDLQEAIASRLFSAKEGSVRISASAGIAALRPGEPGDRPLTRAEFAMYLAKEAGRDGLVSLGEDLNRAELAELEHIGRIRRALDHGALRLSAQPVLHIGSGAVEQWELLVRLRQEGDVIPAAAFLPTAERFGLVEHIDRWVMRRAIGILAERSGNREAVRLEVNLSRRSIGDPMLLDLLREELDPDVVRPWDLILELREDAIHAEPSAAEAFAAHVRAFGCRIAVDDFSGEDDRAVATIESLAPDFVKISGELVRHLPGGDGDRAAVRRIIALARGQGKQTIAQFVGDDETIALLGHYGVDYAQGYHIGVPGPVSEIRPRRAPPRDASPGARPPARRVHLGESLVLPGLETQLRVAALRVIDPLPDGASGKARRRRLVGVEVELENVGASRYAYVPNGCARLVTDKGARAARTSSSPGQGPGGALQAGVELEPGATVRGCLPFLVRRGHRPESFRFVPESGLVTGEWRLD